MAGFHVFHASGPRSAAGTLRASAIPTRPMSGSAHTGKRRGGSRAMQGLVYGVALSSVLWVLIALLVARLA